MKDVARRALLLDYYGDLLTDKQRDVFEWYYQLDLSLGEISEVANVSRNAVHDLVSRTEKKLERYEAALGLISDAERQRGTRDRLAQGFRQWLKSYGSELPGEAAEGLCALIKQIAGE